jgi:hypothetical protein
MIPLRPIDQYFHSLSEPAAGCMQALRAYLLAHPAAFTEAWKYRMPLYCHKGKMFCYLWTRKDSGQPYLGIVNGAAVHHPELLQEQRKRMKILLIDPLADLPLEKMNIILRTALSFR